MAVISQPSSASHQIGTAMVVGMYLHHKLTLLVVAHFVAQYVHFTPVPATYIYNTLLQRGFCLVVQQAGEFIEAGVKLCVCELTVDVSFRG